MEELIKIDENIKNKIYIIRGKQVMLDFDLAEIYGCKNGTKTINQAIGRHLDRFPSDFYFKLDEIDEEVFWSQVGTKKNTYETRGGKIKNASALTEQGVAMLATILRTERATEISIAIMRTFVEMRHYLYDNQDIYKTLNYINNKMINFMIGILY